MPLQRSPLGRTRWVLVIVLSGFHVYLSKGQIMQVHELVIKFVSWLLHDIIVYTTLLSNVL